MPKKNLHKNPEIFIGLIKLDEFKERFSCVVNSYKPKIGKNSKLYDIMNSYEKMDITSIGIASGYSRKMYYNYKSGKNAIGRSCALALALAFHLEIRTHIEETIEGNTIKRVEIEDKNEIRDFMNFLGFIFPCNDTDFAIIQFVTSEIYNEYTYEYSKDKAKSIGRDFNLWIKQNVENNALDKEGNTIKLKFIGPLSKRKIANTTVKDIEQIYKDLE